VYLVDAELFALKDMAYDFVYGFFLQVFSDWFSKGVTLIDVCLPRFLVNNR
jgi:hypothetical protein